MLDVVLFIVVLCPVVSGDVFTSIEKLQDVAYREQFLVLHLRHLRNSLLQLQYSIDRYLSDFDETVSRLPRESRAYMETVAGNPLHAFQMIRRLVLNMESIKRHLLQTHTEHLEDQLADLWPNQHDDLHGAAGGILLLQDIYSLVAGDLARGIISNHQSTATLSATECLLIGDVAKERRLLDRAIEWYEEAANIQRGQHHNASYRFRVDTEVLLQAAINKHDEIFNSVEPNPGYRLYHQPIRLKSSRDQRQEINTYVLEHRLYDQNYDAVNYQALCQGNTLLPYEEESRLQCFQTTRDHPFHFLQPIKIEQHSFTPKIITIHDVISDNEIKRLLELAKPLLTRSVVKAVETAETTEDRTSQTAWMLDDIDLVARLSRRVASATGLDTNTTNQYNAEHLQVLNYGIGGQYRYHHDFMLTGDKSIELSDPAHPGDRLGTFMFYLSDVELGGATAFPRAGISIHPTKGSAAFWYNLKDDGTTDPMTLHAGCPVILGSKWVANKWILEKGQMFKKPCRAPTQRNTSLHNMPTQH